MAVDFFFGGPPDHIKQWILDNTHKKSYWDELVLKLEAQDSLPVVGSSLTVPYKVDPEGEAVDTEWMILGYNSDIPRFVKYKNGNNRVYMDVLPGTSLLTSFVGANVYSNKDEPKDETDLVGTVADIGGTNFTYGNNNTYSVPEEITVNGTEYTFCGYNVTLQSKYGLAAKFEGNLYTRAQFNSQNHNDWNNSEIRTWLNGTDGVVEQGWSGSGTTLSSGEIVGLLGRLSDDFTNNIIPTVTRTWVHSSWRYGTEVTENIPETTANKKLTHHLADKFRLLGVGEVNCYGNTTNNYFPDGGALIDNSVTPNIRGFDTSRFDDVFNQTDALFSDKSRQREVMNEDGTKGSACQWWLRSAFSGGSSNVGYVYDGGYVSYQFAYNAYAVLPACLIG